MEAIRSVLSPNLLRKPLYLLYHMTVAVQILSEQLDQTFLLEFSGERASKKPIYMGFLA